MRQRVMMKMKRIFYKAEQLIIMLSEGGDKLPRPSISRRAKKVTQHGIWVQNWVIALEALRDKFVLNLAVVVVM